MSAEPYEAIKLELDRDFPRESITRKPVPPSQVLFRITEVPTPAGCTPTRIRVLLVYSSATQPPEVLIDPWPTLANGSPAPNSRPKQVDGETWYDYSVKWSWEPSQSIWENVRRKIMRFASNQ